MKLSAQLQTTLTRINTALVNGLQDELEKCLQEADLPTLLSQETITHVRSRNKTRLCNFLCTLAVANEVEPERAQVWLDVYRSISTQQLQAGILKLPANNVWRQAVEALIRKSPLQPAELKNAQGGPRRWQDALELLVDTRDWRSAVTLLETLSVKRVETRRWFDLSKALTNRQELMVDASGIAVVDVDYDRLARLYQLCANAARNAKGLEVARSLEFVRASCLEVGGHYAAAIELLSPLDRGARATGVKYAIARNMCKSGDLEGSIAQLDKTLRAHAIDKRKLDAAIKAPPKKKAVFDVKRASQTLSDLVRVVEQRGEKLFLVSGTLLGYEREGKLMAHDKDIDVGIIGWEKQYDICMALQESGLFTVDTKFLKGAGTHYIVLSHNLNGMNVDLFIYEHQGDKLVTGVDFFFGHRQTFAFTPFELKSVNFLGVDMYVPADTDLNLRENFGDWRTPDPSYISHLESPSTTHKGGAAHMLTARIVVLDALLGQKTNKIRKVIQTMRQYAGYPLAMDDTLLNHLEQQCLLLENAAAPEKAKPEAVLEEAYA